jgi:hypothetical protein
MKNEPCHLGVTHSTLVTRVFEAAMNHLGVPSGETRMLSRRSAPLRGIGERVDALSDAFEDCLKRADRLGYQAHRSELDALLRRLTGERRFTAWLPHLNKPIYQEIAFHPDCASYGFLEEGFTSMDWRDRRNARSSAAKIFRSALRCWWVGARYRFTRPMFDCSLPHYQGACAISALAFAGMPERLMVANDLPALPTGTPPGHCYLVLDAIYLQQGVSWDDYAAAILSVLGETSLPAGELRIKFHFADAGAREKFDALCRAVAAEQLPPMRWVDADFAVEDHLTSHDLLVFGTTAMGYYAALAGCRIRCFADRVAGLSLDDLLRTGKLPSDFLVVAGLVDGPRQTFDL